MTPRLLLVAPVLVLPLRLAAAQTPDSVSLPRVVVTATRVSQPTGAAILATSVIDRASLERSGARDVADALRLLPGVSIARSGGPGSQTSIFLRGGESDYVRVLVDGVPVNEPGGAVDLAWLPLADVERIELVRGPASVLYGTDAVTGVVQVFTRLGAGAPRAEFGLTRGRYQSLAAQGSLAAGNRFGGLMLGLTRDRSDGLLPFNNGYDRMVVTGSAHAEPAGSRAILALRGVNDEFHYPTDGAGNVVDRNALRRGRRLIATGSLERALTERIRAELSIGAMNARGIDDDRADSPADTSGLFHYDAVTRVRRRVVDGRLHVRVAPSGVVTVGAELARETQRGDDSSNYSFERSSFSAGRRTRAIYGQWLGELGRVSLAAGLRYDDNDVFGSFRTWRSGAAVRVWSGASVRANVATAFKAPTFLESFNTAFTTGNADLVPERSRSWEVGFHQSFQNGRLAIATTWFDQRFRDMIQYAFVSPDLPNYFNVAAALARGLELELSALPWDRVRAGAAATLLQTRVEDEGLQAGEDATFVRGKRLLRRPPLLLNGTLAIDFPGRSSADLAVRYTGTRDDRDFSTFPATPVTLSAYTRVDLGFSAPIAVAWTGGDLQLTLRLENVLDARYQEVASYLASGRSLAVGLRMGLD
ncbi:MAG TPA: TonB-dependent receptor [Gemmatimonadaceae bacterium]